jgi:hypothetical protein
LGHQLIFNVFPWWPSVGHGASSFFKEKIELQVALYANLIGNQETAAGHMWILARPK